LKGKESLEEYYNRDKEGFEQWRWRKKFRK